MVKIRGSLRGINDGDEGMVNLSILHQKRNGQVEYHDLSTAKELLPRDLTFIENRGVELELDEEEIVRSVKTFERSWHNRLYDD